VALCRCRRRPRRERLVALSVADLDATLAELSGRGINPARVEVVGGGHKATVFDTDGNSVAIIQVPA